MNANYPGTKLAITEYNWGGVEDINGALAHADVLGIFGREGLDLATLWDPPSPSEPGAFAFRMFRNYDGAGSRFGETSVHAGSADQDKLAVYAATRQDGMLTIMLINKMGSEATANLTLTHFIPAAAAAVYRYSAADPAHVVHLPDVPITPGTTQYAVPGSSITLLVVPPFDYARPDFDRDTDVDASDLQHFSDCRGAPLVTPPSGCEDADLDGDHDVDQSDFGLLQRCMSGSGIAVTAACM